MSRGEGQVASEVAGTGVRRPGLAEVLKDRALLIPVGIGVSMQVFQQFSGINNAFNYSSTFLKMNGLGDDTITTIAIAMNCGNVLVVLLSSVLMDRLGRRTLLLLSIGGMAAASALLTAALLLGLLWLLLFLVGADESRFCGMVHIIHMTSSDLILSFMGIYPAELGGARRA